MALISSKWTWFYKKAMPVFFIGIAAAAVVPIIMTQGHASAPPLFITLVPVLFLGGAFFIMRRLTRPLFDEV